MFSSFSLLFKEKRWLKSLGLNRSTSPSFDLKSLLLSTKYTADVCRLLQGASSTSLSSRQFVSHHRLQHSSQSPSKHRGQTLSVKSRRKELHFPFLWAAAEVPAGVTTCCSLNLQSPHLHHSSALLRAFQICCFTTALAVRCGNLSVCSQPLRLSVTSLLLLNQCVWSFHLSHFHCLNLPNNLITSSVHLCARLFFLIGSVESVVRC